MPNTTSLQLLNVEHAEAVHGLELECFPSPWSLKQIRDVMGMDNSLFAGLYKDEELAGYISAFAAAREMEILNVAVGEKWRRLGLGQRLLELMLKTAREMGIVDVFLEVRERS